MIYIHKNVSISNLKDLIHSYFYTEVDMDYDQLVGYTKYLTRRALGSLIGKPIPEELKSLLIDKKKEGEKVKYSGSILPEVEFTLDMNSKSNTISNANVFWENGAGQVINAPALA